MLAGCSSSTLLSPRHRLRSESPAQFQACHFQLPSMSTQRLDLPCTFSRTESSRPQPIRPAPPLATSTQSEKDEFWEKGKSLKRLAEQGSLDDSCTNRAKRKRGSNDNGNPVMFMKLSEKVVEHEVGNGSRNPHPQEGTTAEAAEENHQEYQAFELVSFLTACVEAIGSKNMALINHCIAKLGDLASPKGTAFSRLSAYYTEALALSYKALASCIYFTTPREFDRVDDDSGTALRLLNQVSPIPKFIHFTANEILLRAFEGKDRVHIIDFDIKQGLQWPSLLQSLASRTNPPSHVRITGIGESKQELNETGDRLAGFAEALNLHFEFHPVVDRSTNPSIILMAEQEAEHNAPNLEARVCNSLKYYSAIFDSINSSVPLDSPVRIKIEEMFAREIRNIVACEGSDRLERHESFEKWIKLMEQGGLRCMVSEREVLQSQMLLKMYSCEDYRVKQRQDRAALTLSWLDQPLYTISAWAPLDVVGSSSSFSQPS
ncbi:hypothetical protein GH714_009928 [Hevea brasiliensis]|uniref:Uncharacterized protein n=1 Tax=Hevea brasiliensis TaxID=3981 RepID=A0A6A6MJT4_HEVBR|nr:hypothetical protein GH714_009928 [Hevea brasiliensis]